MENNNDVYYITRDYLRGLEIGGAATVRPSPYWNGAPACKRTVVVGTYIYARYWIRLDQSTITIAP